MKAITIGSGIGGSAIGALLAHDSGNQVELFEKNSFIGGRFASYFRDGFRLDVGCHVIANCDKGSMHRVLKIIGSVTGKICITVVQIQGWSASGVSLP